MQKTSFFLSRERAKFVPMDSVAGSAGGTTIVIKSSARTTIKCQASYNRSICTNQCKHQGSHIESNKIYE